MTTFVLPDLGEGLSGAIIHEWHCALGTQAHLDEPLLSVETAKAIVDIPSPVTGVLKKIYAKSGQSINIGDMLATFGTKMHRTTDSTLSSIVGKLEPSRLTDNSALSQLNTHRSTQAITRAQPAARALAAQLNIDLSKVKATGAYVRIDDVLKSSHAYHSKQVLDLNLSGARQKMAYTMTQAACTTVPATLTALLKCSNSINDLYPDTLVAICQALKHMPMINAHYQAHTAYHCYSDQIHLGIAIHTEKGLFTPVIRHAQRYCAIELRKHIDCFKEKTAKGLLTPQDTHGATFIVSNIGSLGIGRFGTPILMPPCVGILALGCCEDTAVWENNSWQPHRILPVSLTFDHRVVYGAEAAYFFKALEAAL